MAATGKRRGPAKGTHGRPRTEVDWSKVDALCKWHAPANEIADTLSLIDKTISYNTLDRRAAEEHGITFGEYVRQKQSALCKNRLRELQWQTAANGNAAMQIWLGKQYLGQSDKSESKVDLGVKEIEIKVVSPETHG